MNPVDYLRSPGWSDSKAGWFTDAAQLGGLMVGSAGPHLADFLLWYGGPIVEVATRVAVSRTEIPLASGEVVHNVSSEDTFVTMVRFAGGGIGTVRGIPIANHGGGGFGLELYGTGGTLIVEGGALRGATATEGAPAPLPVRRCAAGSRSYRRTFCPGDPRRRPLTRPILRRRGSGTSTLGRLHHSRAG